MNKFLKFLLNGGSAFIFLIIAVNFFTFNVSFGFDKQGVYQFSSYFTLLYLLIQGVQFNLQKVSSIRDAALDISVSIIPFLYMFYIFIAIDLNDNWSFIRNIFMLSTVIDVFVF